MIEDNQEFDYKVVLSSYSIQDVALEQSLKHKEEKDKLYSETLQPYKELTRESFDQDEQHRSLFSRLVEKLNIKHSVNHLQVLPNRKTGVVQDEMKNLYEKMTKDSDDFVSAVKQSVGRFQNLGNEFNESVIFHDKSQANEKMGSVENEIEGLQGKYNTVKRHEDGDKLNMTKSLTCVWKGFDLETLKADVTNFEKHLLRCEKNIDFLKLRNQELKLQCEIL